MAFRITELNPYRGFCAETGGGVILAAMAGLGIPVSTTQAILGAIMVVGSTRRLSAVRWGIGKRIVYAWLITIPCSNCIYRNPNYSNVLLVTNNKDWIYDGKCN